MLVENWVETDQGKVAETFNIKKEDAVFVLNEWKKEKFPDGANNSGVRFLNDDEEYKLIEDILTRHKDLKEKHELLKEAFVELYYLVGGLSHAESQESLIHSVFTITNSMERILKNV